MIDSTFLCLCKKQEPTNNWLVWCLRCRSEIGTLSTDLLREAVFRTAKKGGILCPKCREKSCKFCGVDMQDVSSTAEEIRTRACSLCIMGEEQEEKPDCIHDFKLVPRRFQKLIDKCPLCVLERAIYRRARSYACLVSHISTDSVFLMGKKRAALTLAQWEKQVVLAALQEPKTDGLTEDHLWGLGIIERVARKLLAHERISLTAGLQEMVVSLTSRGGLDAPKC